MPDFPDLQLPPAVESGVSRMLSPSGGDDSAAMVSALTNFAPFASPVVKLAPGTFQWTSQVPAFLRNSPAKVFGAGRDKTFIQLSVAAPRAFDFNKVADYDTFNQIELSDFTVDCNNVTGTHHVVLGTLIAGAFTSRLNLQHIELRRIRTVNVPTSLTGAYTRRNVSMVVSHLADLEATQTVLNDILLEDCRFEGGAYGGQVCGTSPGNNANIKWDLVRFVRCWHDSLVTPVAGQAVSAASWFIGSAAFGGTAYLEDCYGANSRDLIYEIDNATNATYVNCISVDGWTGGFMCRNFRAPLDLAAQTVRYIGCMAINANLDPAVGGPQGAQFSVAGDNATARYVFGRAIYQACTGSYQTPLANASISGLSLYVNNIQVREVIVNDFTVAAGSLNVNLTANVLPTFVDLRSAFPGSKIKVDGVTFKFAGARAGAFTFQWRMVRIGGSNASRMDVRGITGDVAGIAGLSGNDTFNWLMLDNGGAAFTLAGTVEKIVIPTVPGGGNHNGVLIPSTATLTIPSMIRIRECDLANLPASGTDYSIDATQAAKVEIENWVSARAGAQGPLQAMTAIAVGASPFTYTNADSLKELVYSNGGSGVTVSVNQGGVVAVNPAAPVLLRPGDSVTYTYTTAPTLNKAPATI